MDDNGVLEEDLLKNCSPSQEPFKSMGRAKLNMELISKEKSRNTTFKKRKEGLIKKMREFTTLCDVKACMIIYGPIQEKGPLQPDIWPEDVEEVRRIISVYKSKSKDSGNKTFGLPDFFHDRKRKIEDELRKLRKNNMEAKYPTRLEFMNFMNFKTEVQLREFAADLANKADYVRNRIEFLRNCNEGGNMNLMDCRLSSQSQAAAAFYEVINQQAMASMKPLEMHVPIDHHQELHAQNSMMMLLMNDNDHRLQFGGPSAAGNIQCAAFKREVFYELTAGRGVVDPMMCTSPRLLARCYNTPPVVQPQYMQYAMVPGMAPPPLLQFPGIENSDGGQEDVLQYQMKNLSGDFRF